jgi:Zn-dependent protease
MQRLYQYLGLSSPCDGSVLFFCYFMIETILIILCIAAPAIILHEYAHGWTAWILGDPTARNAGRLTLNPLKHIDVIGTVVVPGLLYLAYSLGWTQSLLIFGWAKPIPVDFRRLRNPKKDILWVGIAGPLINIFLAFMAVSVYKLHLFSPVIQKFLVWGVMLNLGLAIFNMLPIPPLDGSRVVASFIPRSWEKIFFSIEPFGFIIVIVLLNIGALKFLGHFIYTAAFLMGLR